MVRAIEEDFLAMNAESAFAPLWIESYLSRGYDLDSISRSSLRSNIHQHELGRIKKSRGFGSLQATTSRTMRSGRAFSYLKMATQVAATTRTYSYDAMHIHSLEIRGLISALSDAKKTHCVAIRVRRVWKQKMEC